MTLNGLNGTAAIAGIGETAYSRSATESALELQLRASMLAIADAGLEPTDIDGVIPVGITGAPAEEYVHNLGLRDLRFSGLVPHGGASAVGAIQMAAAAVATGIATTVLVPAGRNVSHGAKAGVRIHSMPQFHYVTEFERPVGALAPAQLYAPMARRHMETYGTTSRQLAEIAVAVRSHAVHNENAVMRKPITVEDHQASRMISDPFRLLDCSLESDGGAAYIVTTPERARDLRHRPVVLRGCAMGHPDSPSAITQRPDMTSVGVAKAAPIAFRMAEVSHADIDVAEIYDCFTWVVLCQLEDLGFCAKGEGGKFVEDGRLRHGGALPTNTHGGLLSQGHMLGMNHVVELVRQLRGDGGATQVEGARVGIVTGYGDMGDGAVAILEGA
ncbi:thiolase family protein [Pseudonocardia sp. RS010]|uniref:thiolase family protein n=1 Tax=Pseudonocardia sp. RS010 TaxID=3385979 RepID=UPI0039A0A72B